MRAQTKLQSLVTAAILAAAITTNTFFARFDKILDRGAARI